MKWRIARGDRVIRDVRWRGDLIELERPSAIHWIANRPSACPGGADNPRAVLGRIMDGRIMIARESFCPHHSANSICTCQSEPVH